MKSRNEKLITIRKEMLGCKTQNDFAKLTGLHKQTIVKLESGGRPSHYTIEVLDAVFKSQGLSLDTLALFR